jgi:hypothetical protein
MENARQADDPRLPSSPSNGLRRSGAESGRALYDRRDINEHVDNAILEVLGLPIQNWRKEAGREIE